MSGINISFVAILHSNSLLFGLHCPPGEQLALLVSGQKHTITQVLEARVWNLGVQEVMRSNKWPLLTLTQWVVEVPAPPPISGGDIGLAEWSNLQAVTIITRFPLNMTLVVVTAAAPWGAVFLAYSQKHLG